MRYTTLLALLIGVMLYLVMGALVFRTLEAPKEITAYQDLVKTKEKFLDNKSCLTEQDLQKLVKVSHYYIDAGLDVSSLSSNFTSRWDWASSIFFCGTRLAVGGGRWVGGGGGAGRGLFCVCYALVGIPMFGILLAGVSDHMGTVLRRAVGKIETLFLKRMVRPTTVRVISAVLSILIGCLIFLAVPTVVFQKVESWSFPESLYFVVITLTTVGFGDYVPGDGREDDVFFKPLVWLWIVFGLAYFASILTMIGNWLRVLSKRTRAEVMICDPAEKQGSASNSSCMYAFTSDFCACSPPLTQPFIRSTLPEIILPSPPLNTAASASCQLLDFFGENLAYIDESSDALSDRSQSEEKKRWPRRSKRRSMRRQLSHSWNSLQLRRPTIDSQPPSHPPTPPPDFSLSDLSDLAEKKTHTATEL
uniref:Potassium two pore domain channel subfamily K member 4 n=1 Tax=Cynoglossus semilaevis TaxID=244447 RepID=A0A3P8V949_CYNSE